MPKTIFECWIQWNTCFGVCLCSHVDAYQRCMHSHRWLLPQKLAHQYRKLDLILFCVRQIRIMIKLWRHIAFSSGKAIHSWAACILVSCSGATSVCEIPCPAVIKLTWYGRINCFDPRLSVCIMVPSIIQVKVCRPICGCGPTSKPSPCGKCTGPAWSKSTMHLSCVCDGWVRLVWWPCLDRFLHDEWEIPELIEGRMIRIVVNQRCPCHGWWSWFLSFMIFNHIFLFIGAEKWEVSLSIACLVHRVFGG